MEQAFDVSLVSARLADGRVARFAPEQPAVPASLASQVTGVVGLSTVAAPQPQLVPADRRDPSTTGGKADRTVPGRRGPGRRSGGACPGAANTGGYTANQLAAAVRARLPVRERVGRDRRHHRDLRARAVHAVGHHHLRELLRDQHVGDQHRHRRRAPGTTVQLGEAALDIEDVIGLAPGATVKVFTGPQTGPNNAGPIDTYEAMVADTSLKVITTSWGLCEPQMAGQGNQQAVESILFAEAAAQGQTVVAASGDSGSTDCYPAQPSTAVTVDDPADQPDVTGVGGTSLLSAGSPPDETVWNDLYGSGGGGVSSDFDQPSWQSGPGVDDPFAVAQCAALGRSSCREVPDVSASSDPAHGYAIYCTGGRSPHQLREPAGLVRGGRHERGLARSGRPWWP